MNIVYFDVMRKGKVIDKGSCPENELSEIEREFRKYNLKIRIILTENNI